MSFWFVTLCCTSSSSSESHLGYILTGATTNTVHTIYDDVSKRTTLKYYLYTKVNLSRCLMVNEVERIYVT